MGSSTQYVPHVARRTSADCARPTLPDRSSAIGVLGACRFSCNFTHGRKVSSGRKIAIHPPITVTIQFLGTVGFGLWRESSVWKCFVQQGRLNLKRCILNRVGVLGVFALLTRAAAAPMTREMGERTLRHFRFGLECSRIGYRGLRYRFSRGSQQTVASAPQSPSDSANYMKLLSYCLRPGPMQKSAHERRNQN
jgi:hypothetical protein